MEIVIARPQDNSEYGVPALLLERLNDGRVLVEFPAGNRRVVSLGAVSPATVADVREFEASRAAWKN